MLSSLVFVGSASKGMDSVLDLGWHGKLGPMSPMDSLARHETIKIIPTLLVPSGTKGECANDTWRHGVNVLLVRLDILSIFNATMFDVVHVETSDNCAGTEGLGNSQPVLRNTISMTICGG
jgi:hypothetical protein